MRKKYFFLYRILPVLFVIGLLIPFLNQYIPLVKKINSSENRVLAEKPIFDIEYLDPFPEEYERYYNDKFSLRNNLNNLYNYLRFKFQGANSYSHKVIVGESGWMFFRNRMLPSNRANNYFSDSELRDIATELIERKEYLEQNNCKFYIGIIPAKVEIYSDELGPEEDATKGISLSEQFCSYMDSATDVHILNLRNVLLEKKQQYKLYHKFDHHWNQLGGFFASEAMLNFIRNDSNIVNTVDIKDYEIEYKQESGGNLAKVLGIGNYCFDNRPKLHLMNDKRKLKKGPMQNYPYPEKFKYTWGYEIRKQTKYDTLPNCMIIRDSFGANFTSFLSQGFYNSFFLWDKWEYFINKEIFQNEKPDILIIMIPDFHLYKLKNKSK